MIIISYLRQKEKRKGGGREGTDHNSVPVRLVAMEISKEGGGGGGGEEGNRRGQITMYVKIHTILLLDPPPPTPFPPLDTISAPPVLLLRSTRKKSGNGFDQPQHVSHMR